MSRKYAYGFLIVEVFVISVILSFYLVNEHHGQNEISKPVVAKKQTPVLPRPRFRELYEESLASDDDSWFDVYQDRETGQEIVCYSQGRLGLVSCWLTGRSWKPRP